MTKSKKATQDTQSPPVKKSIKPSDPKTSKARKGRASTSITAVAPFDPVDTGAKLLGMAPPAPAAETREPKVLTSTVPLAHELSPKERAEAMAKNVREGSGLAEEIENIETQSPEEPIGSPSAKNRRVHLKPAGRRDRMTPPSGQEISAPDPEELIGMDPMLSPGEAIDHMLNPEGNSLGEEAFAELVHQEAPAPDLVEDLKAAAPKPTPAPTPCSVLCVIIPPHASCSIITNPDGSVNISTTGSIAISA